LRLRPDGTPRVTIPLGGSLAAAREFVERNRPWLEQQWEQMQARPRQPATLQIGSDLLFRGQLVQIQSGQPGFLRLDGEILPVSGSAANLRPAIEKHLRRLAACELPVRVSELALAHGFSVSRVTVRNQRTRWGSCSRQGAISLNWRLIQSPAHVRDYIILHELAHLRQMNHSHRFWQEVERLCPDYQTAERWLKDHRGLLREE
jgi:predicted metal-dependent hydrolase